MSGEVSNTNKALEALSAGFDVVNRGLTTANEACNSVGTKKSIAVVAEALAATGLEKLGKKLFQDPNGTKLLTPVKQREFTVGRDEKGNVGLYDKKGNLIKDTSEVLNDNGSVKGLTLSQKMGNVVKAVISKELEVSSLLARKTFQVLSLTLGTLLGPVGRLAALAIAGAVYATALAISLAINVTAIALATAAAALTIPVAAIASMLSPIAIAVYDVLFAKPRQEAAETRHSLEMKQSQMQNQENMDNLQRNLQHDTSFTAYQVTKDDARIALYLERQERKEQAALTEETTASSSSSTDKCDNSVIGPQNPNDLTLTYGNQTVFYDRPKNEFYYFNVATQQYYTVDNDKFCREQFTIEINNANRTA